MFVGPQPEVIELMSRKDRARRLATEAGAPVVPAVEGEDLAALAARVGPEIGFPALVKAVAGGGGRGMRLVTRPADLAPALAAAGREALAAFGDAALFVERYLPEGRHLEVQVVGDGGGRVLHLGDRDCSVQRRHQKVVEEAPASPCSPVARARALEAATAIAARVSLPQPGDGRVPGRRRRGPLPGDEHPPPGGARGDRGGDRARPGGAAAPPRRR